MENLAKCRNGRSLKVGGTLWQKCVKKRKLCLLFPWNQKLEQRNEDFKKSKLVKNKYLQSESQ